MTEYRRIEGFDGVQRIDDGAWIPNAPGNRDWDAFQTWLAEGNTPLDPPPNPPAPEPLPEPDLREMDAAIRELEERMNAVENEIGGRR